MLKLIAALLLALTGTTLSVAYFAPTVFTGGAGHFGDHPDLRVTAAPEIDPTSAIAGLTLLLGGVAVLRGRTRKTPVSTR